MTMNKQIKTTAHDLADALGLSYADALRRVRQEGIGQRDNTGEDVTAVLEALGVRVGNRQEDWVSLDPDADALFDEPSRLFATFDNPYDAEPASCRVSLVADVYHGPDLRTEGEHACVLATKYVVNAAGAIARAIVQMLTEHGYDPSAPLSPARPCPRCQVEQTTDRMCQECAAD